MIVGEIALITGDVRKTADFYRWLLRLEGESDDTEHQFLLAEGTALVVCRADDAGTRGRGGITIAFTVDDVDAEHERLLSHGVKVLTPPVTRPWGARNMCFLDVDGNEVYFRQFI